MGPPGTRPAPIPPPAELTGAVVGRFRVGARLGAGGMGEVYAAEDTTLKRTVALKRVSPARRGDTQSIERILREAERASALNHPCVASIYDVFQHGEDVFLVMEYVQGVSLRERMTARISVHEVIPIAMRCAQALGAAHEKGIVHRDVKPENIMITGNGQVKLLDFGIAGRMAPQAPSAETSTVVDGVAGTLGYMAPEVLLQGAADGRCDLFSLGVVLYEALTGVHPFRGSTAISTTDRTLHDEPTPASQLNPAVPAAFDRVLTRLMAKKPADRYAGAADLIADLHSLAAESDAGTPTRFWRAASLEKKLALGIVLTIIIMAGTVVLLIGGPLWRHGNGASLAPSASGKPASAAGAAGSPEYKKALEQYREQGAALAEARRFEEAEAEFKEAVARFPSDPNPHAWLGGLYVSMNRYGEAVREWQRAITLAPDSATAYARLGGADILLGDYEAAIAALKKGIAIRPSVSLYSNLGTAYLDARQFGNATEAFENAARLAGSDYVAVGNLARAYYWGGKRERASATYRRAITLAEVRAQQHPAEPDPYVLMASYYAMLGERATAVRNLATARKLAPDDAELWFWGGVLQNAFGDKTAAIGSLEHALALGYSRSEVRAAPEFDDLHGLPAFQALVRAH